MEFVRAIANRVTVLHEGSVLTEGTMDEVQNDPTRHTSLLGGMMLQIDGLNQFYGGSHTLWDVEMNVNAGSCLCLMGRNGVGKTTLLKCIMGLMPIRNGKISFMGEAITHFKPEQRAGLGIGYVPQGRDIFPLLTVEEKLENRLTCCP